MEIPPSSNNPASNPIPQEQQEQQSKSSSGYQKTTKRMVESSLSGKSVPVLTASSLDENVEKRQLHERAAKATQQEEIFPSVNPKPKKNWRDTTHLKCELVSPEEVKSARLLQQNKTSIKNQHLQSLPHEQRAKVLKTQFNTGGMYIRVIDNSGQEKNFVANSLRLTSFSLQRGDSNFIPFLNLKALSGKMIIACLPDSLTPIFSYKTNPTTNDMFSEAKAPDDMECKLLSSNSELLDKIEERQERSFSVYPEHQSGHIQEDGSRTKPQLKASGQGYFGKQTLENNEVLVNGYDLEDVQCTVCLVPDDCLELFRNLGFFLSQTDNLELSENIPIAFLNPKKRRVEVLSKETLEKKLGTTLKEQIDDSLKITAMGWRVRSVMNHDNVDEIWSKALRSKMTVEMLLDFGNHMLDGFKELKASISVQSKEQNEELLLDTIFSVSRPASLKNHDTNAVLNILARHYCQPIANIAVARGHENSTSIGVRAALNAQWLAREMLPNTQSEKIQTNCDLIAAAALYQATFRSQNPKGEWQQRAAKFFLKDFSDSDYQFEDVQRIYDAMLNRQGNPEAEIGAMILKNCLAITDIKGTTLNLVEDDLQSGATTHLWANMNFPVEIWENPEKRNNIIQATRASVNLASVSGGTPANVSGVKESYRTAYELVSETEAVADNVFANKVDLTEDSYTELLELQKDNIRRQAAMAANVHGSNKMIHNEYTLRQIPIPDMQVHQLMNAANSESELVTGLAQKLREGSIVCHPRLGTLTQAVLASPSAKKTIEQQGLIVNESDRYIIDRDGTALKVTLFEANNNSK